MKAHYFYSPKVEKLNWGYYNTMIYMSVGKKTFPIGEVTRESQMETVSSASNIVMSLQKKRPTISLFTYLFGLDDINFETLLK